MRGRRPTARELVFGGMLDGDAREAVDIFIG
jgi:hypothetical protein